MWHTAICFLAVFAAGNPRVVLRAICFLVPVIAFGIACFLVLVANPYGTLRAVRFVATGDKPVVVLNALLTIVVTLRGERRGSATANGAAKEDVNDCWRVAMTGGGGDGAEAPATAPTPTLFGGRGAVMVVENEGHHPFASCPPPPPPLSSALIPIAARTSADVMVDGRRRIRSRVDATSTNRERRSSAAIISPASVLMARIRLQLRMTSSGTQPPALVRITR